MRVFFYLLRIMRYENFLTLLVLASQKAADGKCVSAAKGRCQRSESRSDHALQGHVCREVKVSRFPACYAECEKGKRCMSTNYNLVTQICQLNHQTATTKPSWLVGRKNSIYEEVIDRYPGKYFSTDKIFSR